MNLIFSVDYMISDVNNIDYHNDFDWIKLIFINVRMNISYILNPLIDNKIEYVLNDSM